MAPEVPAGDMAVFQQMDAGGTGRSWIEVVGSEIKSYLGGGSTLSGVRMEAEEWYHIAVVVTEGGGTDTVQMYVNGIAEGAESAKGMEDSEGSFLISRYKGQSGFWHGIIDDMVLIKKALSEDELEDLMTNGAMGTKAVKPEGRLAVNWGNIKSRLAR
jgi:hypothetical protein